MNEQHKKLVEEHSNLTGNYRSVQADLANADGDIKKLNREKIAAKNKFDE